MARISFSNDLPYRFSFMYSFILLVVAFKPYQILRISELRKSVLFHLHGLHLLQFLRKMKTTKMSDFTIYATIAFIIVWTAILFIIKSKKLNRFVIGTLIIAATFCEVIIADTNAFNFNQELSNYNRKLQHLCKCC